MSHRRAPAKKTPAKKRPRASSSSPAPAPAKPPARRKGTRGRPKAGEQLADGVVGVTFHKPSGKWRIRYVRGGKERDIYRDHEDQAHERAAELQLELAGAAPHVANPDGREELVPKGQGIARDDWARLLWKWADKVDNAPTNDDHRATLRTLSSAATAASKFTDAASRLAKIEELERRIAELTRGRKAGQLRDADDPERGAPDRASGAILQ